MEAVQIVQNPGTLVSGKIAASITGQTGDVTASPIFEQMFVRATATAGPAEKASVEPGLQLSSVQAISLSDIPALPVAGRIPVLSPAGEPAGTEGAVAGAAEESATASASEAGFTVTQLLVPSRGKAVKTLERQDSAQGKNPEKKGDDPTVLAEGEVKSVNSELGALKKLEVMVDSLDKTDSGEISISLDEEKSEGFFAENGTAAIPVITPESIVTPKDMAENRTIIPDVVFQVPAQSAFASAEAGIGNESAAYSTVRREGVVDSLPLGKAVVVLKTSDAMTFMKTGEVSSAANTTAPGDIGATMKGTETQVVPAPLMTQNAAVRNIDRDAGSDGEKKDVLNAVKGETILRQVPSGVTVENPAQTIRMGASPFQAEMKAVTGQGREAEAKSARETNKGNQPVSEILLSEADQGATPTNISVSSGDSASQQNAGEGKEGRQVFAPISAPGSFETALRGRTEEIRPTLERTELHESILSQVREKLAAPEAGNGNGQITLKLNPRELGDLQIHLRMQDSKVSVEITAQNPVVRDALVQNLDQLKETLSRQNIAMERFDVMNGNGQSSNQSFREGRHAAQPHFDDTYYPDAAYYPEDPGGKTLAFGDARQNTLVDMRF
jgi:flagellar hook-length control protein FliK